MLSLRGTLSALGTVNAPPNHGMTESIFLDFVFYLRPICFQGRGSTAAEGCSQEDYPVAIALPPRTFRCKMTDAM